jgi:hypothetical protein
MIFLEIAAPPAAARDDSAQVLKAVRLYGRFVIFWRTRVRPTDKTRSGFVSEPVDPHPRHHANTLRAQAAV